MHLQEETKRSEKTYQGKVFYVTRDQAELEDGKLVQRDVVHHSGGVCVVPLTDKGTVLMVQQFRYPMQQVTLEVPAGKIEPGEDPAECGRRELSEEAGRTCERYTYLGKLSQRILFCSCSCSSSPIASTTFSCSASMHYKIKAASPPFEKNRPS